ncbi:hypothetical protein [Halarcobacter sp.]|uniref:hypothetical protein n=1 Tax=Halarcobacter sp. TaxID=2321133 RepID=UPI002AA66069|nr:hypothetical protein [Halarcobacter sp.]
MDYNSALYGIIYIITLIMSAVIIRNNIKRIFIDFLVNERKKIKKSIDEILLAHNNDIENLSRKLHLSRDQLKRIDLTLHPLKDTTETIMNHLHGISLLTVAIKNTLDERKKLEEKIKVLKKENTRLRENIREMELRL